MAIIISDPLEERYESFKQRVAQFKNTVQSHIDTTAAGDVDADYIRNLTINFNQARARIADFLALVGIVQFVKDYEGNQNYDVSVEYGELDSRIAAVIAEIQVIFPASGGWLLYAEWVGGVIVPRQITPVQSASVRALLQAIVDHIGQ